MNIYPVCKWVGGKRKLLSLLKEHMPKEYGSYHEPFLGGGALLFSIQPANAFVSDINDDLISMYNEIKNNAQNVVSLLSTYPNEEKFYYEIRECEPITSLERAARFLYLSRAGFNGLYRVNSKGKFNVSYGKYKSLNFDTNNLLAVGEYLRNNNISIISQDYRKALSQTKENDFVYMDPPYHGTFTGYTKDQFNNSRLKELSEAVKEHSNRGVKILLSNSNHPEVREAFSQYQIIPVNIAWTVGKTGNSRKRDENEVLIKTWL